MCRLLVFAGERASLPHIYPFIEAFAESARSDPYLAEVTGGKDESHDDGWGYVVVGPSSRTVYKSLRPVFEDVRGRQYLKEVLDDEWFLAVLHARKAARGQPVSLENVHPMCVHSAMYGLICVSHNGTVDKDKLAELIEERDKKERLNDTYFLAALLARSSDLVSSLREMIVGRYVKTAANLGIMIPDLRAMGVVVYNVFGEKSMTRERYYRVYRIRGEGYVMYSSSTLVDHYMPEARRVEVRSMPLGNYVEIRRVEGGFEERSYTLSPQNPGDLSIEETEEI